MILDEAVFVYESCGEFGDSSEFDLAALGAEAVASELGEGEDEVGDGGGVGIEEVEVEVKQLAGGNGLVVEVEGAEDEGSRMVGETAGAFAAGGGRFEKAGVGAGETVVACMGVVTVGKAGDAAEDGAECAAEDVGGFAGREVDGLAGDEGEAQGFEAEEQNLVYAAGAWLWRLARNDVSNLPARKRSSCRISSCSGMVVWMPSTINMLKARRMR